MVIVNFIILVAFVLQRHCFATSLQLTLNSDGRNYIYLIKSDNDFEKDDIQRKDIDDAKDLHEFNADDDVTVNLDDKMDFDRKIHDKFYRVIDDRSIIDKSDIDSFDLNAKENYVLKDNIANEKSLNDFGNMLAKRGTDEIDFNSNARARYNKNLKGQKGHRDIFDDHKNIMGKPMFKELDKIGTNLGKEIIKGVESAMNAMNDVMESEKYRSKRK